MSRNPFLIAIVLTILVGCVFALWPGLDLAASAAFFGPDGFPGAGPVLRAVRGTFFYLPSVVMGAFALAWLLGRLGVPLPARFRPAGRSVTVPTGGK